MIDDSTYELHREASAYLDSLRARHLSWNTERVYAGRSALYLTSCAAHGVDWSRRLQQVRQDNTQLSRRLEEAEDDLAAARTSLRRMILDKSRTSDR
ncbi:hypothetical protein A6P39_042535 (plasmid) [Streptomyces sp. FXJ1.172]|uniref:hypothetical protein n=1 Tax=Streptomyces sp. FXJ1.172 TaxID=710705 RepID=UPI0023DD531E|nr:hypothetical protein [Streptomyces sp. FXJ1.172]WEP00847.1 hypothetical protein A6P39_042535 [Streptomyces sp. FXJ1.172]